MKKLTTEDQLKADYRELLHITHNLRFWQKFWHRHFGGVNKIRKEYWENKLDAFLNDRGFTDHNKTQAKQVYKS